MLEDLFEMAVRLKSKLERLEETGTFHEVLERAREGWRAYDPGPRGLRSWG